MARARRSAGQAVAWGRSQHRDRGTEWRGLCLSFVRQAWGLPAVYGSAKEAWRHARKKHPWNGDVDEIPYGAAVFSDRPGGSVWGHVFLAGGTTKTGRRIFWSNDISMSGGINPVTIDAFERRWGHQILGWTEDLNGYDLNLKLPDRGKPDRRPTQVAHSEVPGWWVVDTDTINGRAGPSEQARIKWRRTRGRQVNVVAALSHEGQLWLKTDKGTYYAAEYMRPKEGRRK